MLKEDVDLNTANNSCAAQRYTPPPQCMPKSDKLQAIYDRWRGVNGNSVLDAIKKSEGKADKLKQAVKESLEENPESFFDDLQGIISMHDKYTGNIHAPGVVSIALTMAKKHGLSPDEIKQLKFAAQIHDLGKIFVPLDILNFKGPLDKDKRKIIDEHADKGEEFLEELGVAKVNTFFKDVTELVGSHHKPLDISESDSKKGLMAKILAFADRYNALTTERPYKRALPRPEALSIIVKDEIFENLSY